MPSAQRGPKVSATQPTIGAPKGVPPEAMAKNIAITRPRIAGSVDSCTVLFAVVVKVCADTPMITRTRANSQWLGMMAARAQETPKMAAATKSSAVWGLLRLAARSAPTTDPTAMVVVRNPYWLAPA